MQKTDLFLEALRSLKEWSLVVIGVQTLMFLASLGIAICGNSHQVQRCRSAISGCTIAAALSIIVGFNVIGTIPWSVEHLAEFATSYGDIYQFKNYINLPIWIIAFTQHILAIVSMGYAIVLIKHWTKYS